MVRDADWDEIVLLLFGDVAFVGFWWLLWFLRGFAWASHTPCPSREGRIG